MAFDGSTIDAIHLVYNLLTEAWEKSKKAWAIGTTSTAGDILENTTPAAVGAQQYSPRREISGKGWKTNATAASVDCRLGDELRPVQGSAAPSFLWALMQKIGSGSWTDILTLTSAAVLSVLARLNIYNTAAAATETILGLLGISSTEGLKLCILKEPVACSAVENAMTTAVPKGAIVLGVLANCEAALNGGGTTATWSVGITGTVDKYGSAGFPTQADSLAKNSKSSFLPTALPRLAANETLKVIGAATGGASAGNTALTVGSVKVVVFYLAAAPLADAA